MYIVSRSQYKGNPVSLVKFLENNSIQVPAQKALLQTLILQTAALIFIILFLLISSYIIIKPIKRMTKNMERVEMGEFNYDGESSGRDELAILEKRYSQMVKSIDKLINKNYRYALENTKAKLKVLQAQINPHFLYNMLQYISTNSLKAGANEVNEQIVQLGSIFKYNMDTKTDIITLRDEINHIENYIALQSGRFGNKIRFSVDYDQEVLNIMIPKMILQPLIENSIIHGMGRNTGIGNIHLGIHWKDSLIIQVIDNGKGISMETIQHIEDRYKNYEMPGKSSGIGIVNVLQRLRIYTDDHFKWKITSIPYEETLIELRIEVGEYNESTFSG